jgi:hypothetical protein
VVRPAYRTLTCRFVKLSGAGRAGRNACQHHAWGVTAHERCLVCGIARNIGRPGRGPRAAIRPARTP